MLGGSFKMLAAQLRDFGPALSALVGLPAPELVEHWQLMAEQAHANSIDTPEPRMTPQTAQAEPGKA